MFVAGPMITFVSHKNGSDLPLYYIHTLILFFTVAAVRIILGNRNSVTFGSTRASFITTFENYRQEFKESFPELDERKCFFRKAKAIEDLLSHVATI
jgi:hypothetical protein